MTQVNRTALRDLRTRFQTAIDSNITQNTTGDITGTILNTLLDEGSQLLIDLIDSCDVLDSTSLAPTVRTFVIEGQNTDVAAGTTLSGTVTFDFVLTESDNVDGNLTLRQAAATLSTTIDPKGGSFTQAINSVTLNAGESVTFTLQGTALAVAGGGVFSRTFTVTALQPDDFVYWGLDADGDPSDFNTATAQQAIFARSQTITVPSFSDNQYLVIAQKASDAAITQIFIDGINQFDAFTENPAAFSVNGAPYDAYVTNHALVGTIVSGDAVQIVR